MIQEMIAESSADIRALWLMALHSAWLWDNLGASKARVEIAELKFWGARVLHDVVDRAIQVHGALGWSMDRPLASSSVMARQFRIADGADEVHKSFVANKRARLQAGRAGLAERTHPHPQGRAPRALRRVP